MLDVSESEARKLYEALWALSPRRGAITAAAKLQHALDEARSAPATVVLDDHETAALIAVRGQ